MGSVKGLLEIILYVQDMAAQVSFYRDVLGLPVREPSGVEDFSQEFWVEFETGACTLALHGGGHRQLGQDTPRFVFQVEDVKGLREALLQKGVKLGELQSPVPNHLLCNGTDPEGNPFSLEERLG